MALLETSSDRSVQWRGPDEARQKAKCAPGVDGAGGTSRTSSELSGSWLTTNVGLACPRNPCILLLLCEAQREGPRWGGVHEFLEDEDEVHPIQLI